MDAPEDACVPRTYDLLRVRDCTRSILNAPVDITSNASELIRARARIRSSLCTPKLVSARDYALEIVRDLASARIGLRKAGVVMVVPYLEASYLEVTPHLEATCLEEPYVVAPCLEVAAYLETPYPKVATFIEVPHLKALYLRRTLRWIVP